VNGQEIDHIGRVYKLVSKMDKEIAVVKSKQEDHHIENQKDIGRLYKWMWAITFLIVSASLTVAISAMAG